MDSLAMFAGNRKPAVWKTDGSSPRSAHSLTLCCHHQYHHISKFRPSSFLSVSSGSVHARSATQTRTHIFLPRLVAAKEEVQETYIMVKPVGVQRGLVGEIISRFERKGFLLKGLKLVQCPKELAEAVADPEFFLRRGINILNVKCYSARLTWPCMSGDVREKNVTGEFLNVVSEIQPPLVHGHVNRAERNQENLREHYKDLKDKSFFPKLIAYITSGPVVCMAWEGVGVVASARKLIGATNPLLAEPGTIRGDFDLASHSGRNIVHGSDSLENGRREIALWFEEGELCDWVQAQAPWQRE